jgi:hypothetical protein
MSARPRHESPAVKLAGFAVILAAVFGAGIALGTAAGPALDGRFETVVVEHEGHEG